MNIEEFWEALRFMCTTNFWRMGFFWTICLLVSYFQLWLQTIFAPKSGRYPRCGFPVTTDPSKPVCIITGATSGLGAAAAFALSKEGFCVILVGRSIKLLSKTMIEIKDRNDHADLKAFEVDLSSFQSISKFKVSLEQWLVDSNMHSTVQLLINNAGILAASRRLTTDGYDEMMGTNYLGAFCLTKLLLPLLKNSPVPSRIVNITSFTHRNASNIQVNKDVVSGKYFLGFKQYPCACIYEYSKLFLLLFSYKLHQQFASADESRHVSVIAVDPGAVETNIMRELPSHISFIALNILKFIGLLHPPETGIDSLLDATLSPPETSGVYFFGGKGRTINSSSLSRNTKLAEQLWTTSSDLFLQTQLAVKEA